MGEQPTELRRNLQATLKTYRERLKSGLVVEYSHRTFEGGSGFVRIGKGSLGGKGRGLAFVNSLINTYDLQSRFQGVRVFVPPRRFSPRTYSTGSCKDRIYGPTR